MKWVNKKLFSTCMVAAALIFSTNVWAEEGVSDTFSDLDADHDGIVSKAEIRTYYDHIFSALDVTGDDQLDRDECDYGCVTFKPGVVKSKKKQAQEVEVAQQVKSLFDLMDVDSSDLLSRTEYLNYFEKDLLKKDADKNGKLSRKEFNAN